MAIYIGLGFYFKLNTESYLLLGIPLTTIFQLFVAKQPIYKLWLRDQQKFHLNKLAWTITSIFILYPIYKLTIDFIGGYRAPERIGFDLAMLLGAFAAGFCYSNFTKKTARDFLVCFAITFLLRMSLYFLPFIAGRSLFNPDYLRGLKSLLTYIPVAFVVEEVIFRGMLDTYIQPDKNPSRIFTALFISLLWGLWHLPLSDDNHSVWFAAAGSMVVSLWGIILSIFWRRTGNLAVPGFSHAFADAIRDSLK